MGGRVATFPFYSEGAGGGFNTEGFAQGVWRRAAEGREKLIVLLNFPNNPTGYMPTRGGGPEAIVDGAARSGRTPARSSSW